MPPSRSLADALAAARPFLRGEEAEVDPALPGLAAVLRAAGAGECWHKHGTFLAHLLDVHRILRLWGAPDAVARCGLYHSAYSNSYVNLAIFQPDTGRAHVAAVVGADAERLVHLFCVVPRQKLVHDDLLFHYSDQDLVDDLASSEASLRDARRGVFDDAQPWRRKIQRLIPPDGITVKHIRYLLLPCHWSFCAIQNSSLYLYCFINNCIDDKWNPSNEHEHEQLTNGQQSYYAPPTH